MIQHRVHVDIVLASRECIARVAFISHRHTSSTNRKKPLHLPLHTSSRDPRYCFFRGCRVVMTSVALSSSLCLASRVPMVSVCLVTTTRLCILGATASLHEPNVFDLSTIQYPTPSECDLCCCHGATRERRLLVDSQREHSGTHSYSYSHTVTRAFTHAPLRDEARASRALPLESSLLMQESSMDDLGRGAIMAGASTL